MMNELIKELSKEAWLQVNAGKIGGRQAAYTKLFAEIIIRECANIANASLDPAEDYQIGDDILEYFGVST